ncbi:MAG: glycine cleavage system aminomethyltransferase GcvT [Sphaerochaetaceae bacterium]
MENTTALYEAYKNEPGIKMIDFGDWFLPVNFGKGIIKEHELVRSSCGMFDVSHMGECIVCGKEALNFLDWITTNKIHSLNLNHAIYTLMCYENGTVVDDLIVYRIEEEKFFVVMNAANKDKDLAYLIKNKFDDVEIIDLSDDKIQIAIQGPDAESIFSKVYPNALNLGFFDIDNNAVIEGKKCLVGRTGYTGEDGFELYADKEDGVFLWNLFKDLKVEPCGLGARDSLRLEAKLPLYGHEINDTITPLEANLGYFVDLDKEFCGSKVLTEQNKNGIPRSLRGFEMIDGGVARNGYKIFNKEEEIGYVTSGTKSPTLNKFIGLGMMKRKTGLKFDDEILIEIHGKMKRAKLVKTPFYKNTKQSKIR